ncbi:unnamed protein product [marine sediment metagenome]|uniref:Uncharacterized protein n=1 Tax=marine sediment metagenome TaxID=412755 RepID=X1ANJ2_9ZZZZ
MTVPGKKLRPWDGPSEDQCGYGKHKYREIDPSTINPEDYARTFGGDEEFYGDVREYNSAYNEKHPENKVQLDWLCRVGTVFQVFDGDYVGKWMVADVPLVLDGEIFIVSKKVGEDTEQVHLKAVELGVVVDKAN